MDCELLITELRTLASHYSGELFTTCGEAADAIAALRAEVELAKSESQKARKRTAELSAEVERLEERFDAVRDAAHAEAKRVFPATVIESHIGGELHADDLCGMLAAEVERLRTTDWLVVADGLEADVRRLRLEVERLREERRWRDARTEPPDYPGRYTCLWSDGDMSTQYWSGKKWLGANDYAVTHWQPLPAPPATDNPPPAQ